MSHQGCGSCARKRQNRDVKKENKVEDTLQVDQGSTDQTVSGLAIAGIVIGSIALLFLIGYVYYYYKGTKMVKTRPKTKYTFIYDQPIHT